MKFTKYSKGAYHWRQYETRTKYFTHVERLRKWVTEKNVLDVGAGDGLITAMLDIQGIDNEPEGVKLAQEKGANVILGDAYDIPFPNESFDAVLMADALEHFEFPEKALREALRVLKTDRHWSRLYITTPPKRADGKLTDSFHYQEWTPEGLQELVLGVHIEEVTGTFRNSDEETHRGVSFRLDGDIQSFPEEKIMYARFLKATDWSDCRGTPTPSPSPS